MVTSKDIAATAARLENMATRLASMAASVSAEAVDEDAVREWFAVNFSGGTEELVAASGGIVSLEEIMAYAIENTDDYDLISGVDKSEVLKVFELEDLVLHALTYSSDRDDVLSTIGECMSEDDLTKLSDDIEVTEERALKCLSDSGISYVRLMQGMSAEFAISDILAHLEDCGTTDELVEEIGVTECVDAFDTETIMSELMNNDDPDLPGFIADNFAQETIFGAGCSVPLAKRVEGLLRDYSVDHVLSAIAHNTGDVLATMTKALTPEQLAGIGLQRADAPVTPPTPPEATAEQRAEYLKNGGSRCLFCGSEDIEGGAYSSEVGYISQEIACDSCGATWTDRATLDGVDGSVAGDE